MKFNLCRSSSRASEEEIELTSLEELIALINKEDCSIIVSVDCDGEQSLEVYDGYRE